MIYSFHSREQEEGDRHSQLAQPMIILTTVSSFMRVCPLPGLSMRPLIVCTSCSVGVKHLVLDSEFICFPPKHTHPSSSLPLLLFFSHSLFSSSFFNFHSCCFFSPVTICPLSSPSIYLTFFSSLSFHTFPFFSPPLPSPPLSSPHLPSPLISSPPLPSHLFPSHPIPSPPLPSPPLSSLPRTNTWMGFGLSGSTSRTKMLGADASIVWVENTEGAKAQDYYLSAYTQVDS